MSDDIDKPTIEVAETGQGIVLAYGGFTAPCLAGRSGITAAAGKREGDGATPAGTWPLREVLYRPDRLPRPRSPLPTRAIAETDGWCDDPARTEYNRPVALPFAGSHERLWREDGAYDVVVPLGYNDAPPVPGLGSAIFLHCIPEGGAATEGCVALSRDALVELLSLLDAEPEMVIRG